MANRPVGRKVRIYYEPNDPADPEVLLRAVVKIVVDETRANDIEIHVGQPTARILAPSIPDERLETEARGLASEVLEARAAEIKSRPASAPDRSPETYMSRVGRLHGWLRAKAGHGWRFFAKAIVVAKDLAELVNEIEDIGR